MYDFEEDVVKFWEEKLERGSMGEYCYDMLRDLRELQSIVYSLREEQSEVIAKLNEIGRGVMKW